MTTKTQKGQAASVTDMLREDHKKAQGLFKKFEKAENAKKKQKLAGF